MMPSFANQTFLISRTDAIGDVVLTLPVCGWIKAHIPGAKVVFLGRTYTQAVIQSCPDIDVFLNWDEIKAQSPAEQINILRQQQIDVAIHVFPNKSVANLVKKAGIKLRIGTRNRWFHLFTCNKLVPLSRRRSPLHESQLNLELLRPIGLAQMPDATALVAYLHLKPVSPLPTELQKWLRPQVPHIILHPKSQGSGREWSLEHYGQLARLLHQQGYQVLVTGTTKEQQLIQNWLWENEAYITDVTGKLTLPQFLSFIKACDGLIAAGTGPLHLAAALDIHALGLFPPINPIHPGRWHPLGAKAEVLVLEKDCNDCRNRPANCSCIQQISVAQVLDQIQKWHLPPLVK